MDHDRAAEQRYPVLGRCSDRIVRIQRCAEAVIRRTVLLQPWITDGRLGLAGRFGGAR